MIGGKLDSHQSSPSEDFLFCLEVDGCRGISAGQTGERLSSDIQDLMVSLRTTDLWNMSDDIGDILGVILSQLCPLILHLLRVMTSTGRCLWL